MAEPRSLPLAERVLELQLPSLPAVAVEVLTLCQQEQTTLAQLAEVISRDPALAARLLRFANSSLYNLGHQVTSLQRAALVLGLKTVQLMSLSFSLVGCPPWRVDVTSIDYEEYWRRSLACAVAARTYALLLGTYTEDEAFLCGLLGEIGLLVMAECAEDDLDRVLAATGGAWPDAATERDVLGYDHAELGTSVLRSWGLPPTLYLGVRHIRVPETLPEDSPADVRANAKVLQLAALTVDLLTAADKSPALGRLEAQARSSFDLETETLYEAIHSLEKGIRETASLLSLDVPDCDSYEAIIAEARRERARLLVDERGDGDRPMPSAITLDLTSGLADAAALRANIEAELQLRAGSPDLPLSLLRLSVDGLDEVANTGGTDAADLVVREVAAVLRAQLRRNDFVARVARGEFCVMVGSANPSSLRMLADRLRRSVEKNRIGSEGAGPGTPISVAGLSIVGLGPEDRAETLERLSAQVLAKLREKGGNRVTVKAGPLPTRRAG